MKYSVLSNETRWNYLTKGSGSECLLVLPGALGGGEAILQTFEEMNSRWKVVVPEYAPVRSLDDCMEGLDAIAADIGCRNFAVYGGSFGGMLAQCWVRRNQERVTRLILNGTAGPDSSRIKANRRALGLLPILCYSMAPVRLFMRILLNRMLRDVSRNREEWLQDFRNRIASLQRIDLESRYQVAIDFDRNSRFHPSDLHAWEGRILILEGAHDRVAKDNVREKLRSLYPQATVITFPDAGHALLLSHTDQVLSAVSQFLNS